MLTFILAILILQAKEVPTKAATTILTTPQNASMDSLELTTRSLLVRSPGAEDTTGHVIVCINISTFKVNPNLPAAEKSDNGVVCLNRYHMIAFGTLALIAVCCAIYFCCIRMNYTKLSEQHEPQNECNTVESLDSSAICWHFIPAYSPNFGGLWEAGVKSMKHHLKRILNSNLTYVEFTTVLCQIEACLNSRPLCPVDDTNIESLEVLTPGHFLIGNSPITVPSPNLKDVPMTNLSLWHHTQNILNDFWQIWQQEYLSRLQQRPKWLKRVDEFEIGQIVLIKMDDLPPGKWSLGRIVDNHPGLDGITRVYSVKSGSNIVKRSVAKLCLLPVDTN